ncbi:flavin reductase [Gordonia rubripertincta]|uniref:Flavin reductase n=1 Tax=Gordonia rubripertincta TaxID=36822 RepID=A0ABT4MVU4_GORRU|nr:flavin reductase [Gordonia rubripertincta]MCZ4551087.1 flavin reductase [Gordonia rubripertincta]
MNTIDPGQFRQVMGQYPTGVVVVCAAVPGANPAALTIGSFSSVSLDPPLIAFYPDKSSSSWPLIREQKRFSVNVLSDDQEDLCRKFARKGVDKFAGVPWSPAESGSPLIAGAAAWIDCELYDVQELGDHYLVVGRVVDMGSVPNQLPLLFFRGGYGKFRPSSLAVAEVGLAGLLPAVDAVRPELELVAKECDSECVLVARVHDEFVVLASAGTDTARRLATRVGRRLPFVAPLGAPLAAWSPPEDADRWASPGGRRDPRALEGWQRELTAIRERGYVVGFGEKPYTALESTIGTRSGVELDDDLADALIEVQEAMLNPPEIEDTEFYDVRSLSVPIFASDGRVLQIGLYGLNSSMSGEQLRGNISRLLEAGERCTTALGGVHPRHSGSTNSAVDEGIL